MPNPARRAARAAAIIAAIIAAAVALDLPSAAAQSDDEQAGRIVARRLDDGRTEFGWQPAVGARVLPSERYFPADADVDRWQSSDPVEVNGAEIGRIDARLNEDGRIEFGFTPTDGERILTDARYFPAAPRPNRWLRSTKITIGPPPPDPFTAVSAGGAHTCGLRENGGIECWGAEHNEYDYGQADAPAGRFTAVSAGAVHTCGLREDGAIECWGSNDRGQLDAPAGSFTAVSAGGAHTCGLRENGEIECWGWNLVGEIANIPAGRFAAVSADGPCGLRDTGAIECWGGHYSYGRDEKYAVPNGRFTAISAGWAHACAIRESGEVECWGSNSLFDYTADGSPVDFFHRPADAPAGRFTAVSAATVHSCGVRESGEILCWGAADENYDYGRLTDAPPAGSDFIAVSAGRRHTCGLRTNGAIECWGDNRRGQTDAPAS